MSRRARSVGSQGAGPCNYVSWQGVEYVWGGGRGAGGYRSPPRRAPGATSTDARLNSVGGFVRPPPRWPQVMPYIIEIECCAYGCRDGGGGAMGTCELWVTM